MECRIKRRRSWTAAAVGTRPSTFSVPPTQPRTASWYVLISSNQSSTLASMVSSRTSSTLNPAPSSAPR